MAQVIGYIATIISLCSFQQKTQKGIAIMQTFSTFFFAVHFLMLGAYSGAILNVIGMFRSIVYSMRDKKWASHYVWIIIFSALTVVSYLITVLFIIPDATTKTYFIELLPTAGFIATTFGNRMKEAKLVRRFSLLSSPLWLTYNIINFSIGGMINEGFSILSIIIGMLRLDIKKK